MKRFAGKCLLLFLLVLSSIGVLNFFYARTNYWKNSVMTSSKFRSVPGHIQLANVGSSHGEYSFDYRHVPYRSFNFALSSQRFVYDYAIMKQYIEQFDKNAVLLIPISYFQITRIKTDFHDQNARYYNFLDKQYIEQYSVQEEILFAFLPVLTANNTLNYIIKDVPASVPPSKDFTTIAGTELIKYCNAKYEGWTTNSKNEYDAGEEGFAYNKHLVSQIIELCYAHDIQPVLISTPVTSVLNSMYAERSPDFFDTFYRFTRELQESYLSIRYFDYSHDQRFTDDFPLFRDGDHLNAIGAEKFTALVISDLQASGLLSADP